MSTDGPRNVLCIAAHPDDVELMAGGTVAKWAGAGCAVRILTLTHGAWQSPAGEWMRNPEQAKEEERAAAEVLGVGVENLNLPMMDLRHEDRHVVEVLRRIEQYDVDTLICPWERDLFHDHEVASRIAISASRRVDRVLMGAINGYLRNVFTPNLFVDITDTWELKVAALERYEGEWKRAKEEWLPWLDETTRTYGRMVGVERAEGFVTRKFLLG